ncbi:MULTISPECIES: ABC transporter permease [unclassified Paenibacillus]|uniref:ABC transporter permease n=1 Tax=unclassified Paenibacillus TaxID=185978 RepID=UPI0024056EDF|nr:MULTISPECIES: ABC transporter permease [unclassified Paenibacillus]MDF9843833.1 peptide/nickel transport system permease protein [Paenibacillus sp. PastF-2]MDF9850483.1 peptide/nickel transport system permease protein [Paenibacillus sp. PastM-2]MDF9857012.1 peptide/nickel transport system permease protein [Paenibacillus sp. PastF-1]MDH6482284.1 peptide/nickel transport system permease protein [Paenibacillus sp. PastH-2]MDH6509749.1 peptide/nickel transport system permease protein [Paenibaci
MKTTTNYPELQTDAARTSLIRRILNTPSLLAGGIMFAVLILLAIFIPYISPYDPTEQNLSAFLQPPSAEHWLGTDQLGRDLFTRLIYAARTDLTIMVLAEIIPFCTGIFLGMVAGYYGKWVDNIITLITDTFIAFPFYLIVIIVAFASGAGQRGIYITFILVGWIVFARVVRGLSASFREQEWIASARTLGLSGPRIILRHLLPNVLPQAVVVLMTDMVGLLVAIVTLGYLGIGIAPPTPDWGTMIADGQSFISTAWWLSAVPGFAVVYTGIALSLVGDGLADLWRKK